MSSKQLFECTDDTQTLYTWGRTYLQHPGRRVWRYVVSSLMFKLGELVLTLGFLEAFWENVRRYAVVDLYESIHCMFLLLIVFPCCGFDLAPMFCYEPPVPPVCRAEGLCFSVSFKKCIACCSSTVLQFLFRGWLKNFCRNVARKWNLAAKDHFLVTTLLRSKQLMFIILT